MSSKKEKNQINKIINEKGKVTTENAEIQRVLTHYYEQLYGNKMDNLEEMDRFIREEIEIMNNLTLNLKQLETEEQNKKPKICRRKKS